MNKVEAGISVKELCRKHGFSDGAFHGWRVKFVDLQINEANGPLEFQRQAVEQTRQGPLISKRRARELVDLARTTMRRSVAETAMNNEPKIHIVDLAHARRRFSYRIIDDMLQWEDVKLKRVYRSYRET